MGWLFLFAVLFLMVFLVLNSNRTRFVALGVLSFFAALVAVYFLVIDQAEQQATPPAADEKLEDTRALAEKAALARRAIKPQEVTVESPSFAPGTEQYRAADGQLKDRRDLYSWVFAGAVKNLNADYAVRDVVFRMRLFSCPDFFSGDIELSVLEVRCNKIGDRRLGLYNLEIAPGSAQPFEEKVVFDNQPAPGNWRHQVDVLSVTARIE
ncbi:MAG: hypothetical protein OER56_13630 [Hyphomicrobiales bacterium]|nr:hypothetical protein [Hyphomicrobiales bacterium]